MDIHLKCSSCGQKLVIDHSGSGRSVSCPTCSHPITIPAVWAYIYSKTYDWLTSRTKSFWKGAAVVAFILLCFIEPRAGEALPGMIWLVIMGSVYFLPSIIGRDKRNYNAILALNLLLGWTLVGWVVALVWALTKEPYQR